ncbi:MAG: EXLDI protein [Anaerococcus sp.]|nr:EXLDI protein [Anaerococcus sp.]
MKYEDIRLNVSNDKISDYKVFKGIKLYSEIFKSEDEKKLINKRVYITQKENYVYYERTDINWNYWSDKTKYDSSFDLSDKNHNIIFEVTSELDDFSKYLDEEVIKKIIMKEKREEIVEVLDI